MHVRKELICLQRYFSKKREKDYLFLEANDLYHIKTVMRMQKNDIVEIVYDEIVYECCIEMEKENILFKIINQKENINCNKPYVAIVIPFLKETKIDLILQKSTEMGIDEIILCPMNRCIVKLNENKIDNKLIRWIRICKEASEQSKRVKVPSLKIINKINDLNDLEGICFTCSTQEKEKTIKKALKKHKNCDRINLVIGPEGGLTKEEEDYLEQIGFEKITLGNQIMRVETVPLFLISVINYEYME